MNYCEYPVVRICIVIVNQVFSLFHLFSGHFSYSAYLRQGEGMFYLYFLLCFNRRFGTISFLQNDVDCGLSVDGVVYK